MIRLNVTHLGLAETYVHLFYESTDCSGPPLIDPHTLEEDGEFIVPGDVRGTTFYYHPRSGNTVTYHSSDESPVSTQDCPPPDIFTPPDICCKRDSGGTAVLAPAGVVDLSTLVPPFHLEVQE